MTREDKIRAIVEMGLWWRRQCLLYCAVDLALMNRIKAHNQH